MTDMQKLQDEGEQCCSLLWHQVALCAGSVTQQLTCYQKAITSLSVRLLFLLQFYIRPGGNVSQLLKGIFLASLHCHLVGPTCHYNCFHSWPDVSSPHAPDHNKIKHRLSVSYVWPSFCGQSGESRWLKISLLLEFGEWLYCHNFPRADGQHQVEWAVDILLHMGTNQAGGAGRRSPFHRNMAQFFSCCTAVMLQRSSDFFPGPHVRHLWGSTQIHSVCVAAHEICACALSRPP